MTGDFRIYRLYKDKEYITETFTPTEVKERLVRLLALRLDGWKVVGVLFVDRETYLNYRLAQYVEEHIYNETQRKVYTEEFTSGKISEEVFIDTMSIIDSLRWTKVKQIYSVVRRMIRYNYTVENEYALEVYNTVMSGEC